MKNGQLILATIATLLALTALGLKAYSGVQERPLDVAISVMLVLFMTAMAWSAWKRGERFRG